MTKNGSNEVTRGDGQTRASRATRKAFPLTIETRSQPISIDVSQTAVLVVDMQNDFGSKGGLFDRAGIDLSGIRQVITPTVNVLASARAVGVPIIYIKAGIRPDLSDFGEPGSAHRERWSLYGVGQSIQTPDGRDSRILIRDTWNTDIIPELEPQPDDIVVYKARYSAFYQTELDAVLRQLGVKYLIVTGCTTSVCVESTIRDAYHRDYSCILLADCTAEPIGEGAKGYRFAEDKSGTAPRGGNYDATLLLVQTLFGWVSDSEAVTKAFEAEQVATVQK
jgi:ureidoacrylate peracid hydrolase